MAKRPTFDDMMEERNKFIGPPEPFNLPKLMPHADRAELRVTYDEKLAESIKAMTAADKKHQKDRGGRNS